MADKKGLLNEIALLTNLLGSESPGPRKELQKSERVGPFPGAKTIVRSRSGKARLGSSSSLQLQALKPLSAAAVLALINGGINASSTTKAQDSARATPVPRNGIYSRTLGLKWSSSMFLKSTGNSSRKLSDYTLDRRIRKYSKSTASKVCSSSPRRNSSSTNNLVSSLSLIKTNSKRQLSSPLRKYSIRKYSIRKLKSNTLNAFPDKTRSLNFYIKNEEKGTHQVVRIDGTKYLSRNSGKTLKRIRTSSSSLSNFQCFNKSFSQSHRMANRVLQKSITTLSGGKRKNRVCYFLRNFGYCKRKENSTCPFFHGLSANLNDKKSPVIRGAKVERCRYFRKGECLRRKCPYFHEKDSNRRKETWRLQRQRVKLTKLKSSDFRRRQKISTSETKEDHTALAARYFQTEPDTNPLSSIITRRLPKGVEVRNDSISSQPTTPKSNDANFSINCDTKMVQKNDVLICDAQTVSSLKFTRNSSICDVGENITLATSDKNNPRRQRLMDKLVTFKKRLGKGDNEMPTFLAL